MPRKKKPAYLLHKPTGQARVRIDGRDHYLGPYGSPESRDEYDKLIEEWFARQGDVSGFKLTLDDLSILYMRHVREHHRKNGQPTSRVHCTRLVLRHLVQVHGTTRVRDFGPRKLKEVRQAMIDSGYCRTSINDHVGTIKRMFRWAVENEYVSVEVYQALCTVRGLQKGRTTARESEPVTPVSEGTVNATLPYLPAVVADMVRLQLLTGARPAEVCSMRPSDITFGKDGVWVYRPEQHKTEHHARDRRLFIGPDAQKVLRPYLDRAPEAYCFNPAESESDRNSQRRQERKSPMTPSQAVRQPKEHRMRPPKTHYTKDSYRRAVARACEQAFGMPDHLRNIRKALRAVREEDREAAKARLRRDAAEWRKKHCWSPNQLRHSRATIIREKYGIEAAQVVLGHSDPKVTEIYAERDFAMAARIMREIG